MKQPTTHKLFKNLLITLCVAWLAMFAWERGYELIVVWFLVALVTGWKLEYNTDHENKDK